jgi:cytochrome c556
MGRGAITAIAGRTPAHMRHRPLVRLSVLAAATWLLAGNVIAADADFDQIIDDRQRNLRDMGAAYKAISDELKRPKPNLLEIAHYASSLQEIAASQKQWFPAGSGPESGIKTAAKAEIWAQPADFAKWEEDLSAAIALLVKAAAGQDIEIVRRQHEQVGKACAGCHKTFRTKDD